MNQSRIVCIKKFTNLAKQFINSENVSTDMMIEGLANMAALDFCSLSHNKVDVSLLFNSLWELMSCANAPHWNCVSVLNSAVKDPTFKKLLINTYRFMPILANLLLKPDISLENKLKLLILMEELSIGIDISWQEPYLLSLIKELYNWILNTNDSKSIDICTSSLSLLVNLCYDNLCVINLMIENVDTKNLIRHLVSKKSIGCESIQVCRLLLSLSCIHGIPSVSDVYNYLGVAMQTLVHGIKKVNRQNLYYISILLKDLCSDIITKSHVSNYDHFEDKLQEALKYIPKLLIDLNDESKQCLQIILTILHTLVKLDLYSLRNCHKMMIELCTKTFTISELMPSSYQVLSDIIIQYEEDGMLPDDVASAISYGLRGLLDPLILNVKSAGVSWLSFISALNDCHATRESILHNVKPEKFEEIVKEILQCDCNDNVKEEAVLIACHVSLSFTKREGSWEICLHHLLSDPFTQKILSGCTNNVVQSRRKQLIHIIRHSDFPSNRIDEVFFSKNVSLNKTKDSLNCSDSQSIPEPKSNSYPKTPFLIQDKKLDSILEKVNGAFEKNELHGIATSHLIELYQYKVLATEHRLNAANTSLQSANHAVTQLNHSMALLENTSKFQEEILLNTQIYNEKLKENVASLSEQMEGAEKVIKKFQSKLATEKLDREQCAAKAQWEYSQKLKEVEETMLKHQENMQMQLNSANEHKFKLEEQLSEQVNKNNELTNILIKFEEKVKQKEKKLEEMTRNQNDFKNQLIESQETVQKLEKTLLEREKRLTQVTIQLEEMQKVQDMIANLMGHKGSGNTSSNSTN